MRKQILSLCPLPSRHHRADLRQLKSAEQDTWAPFLACGRETVVHFQRSLHSSFFVFLSVSSLMGSSDPFRGLQSTGREQLALEGQLFLKAEKWQFPSISLLIVNYHLQLLNPHSEPTGMLLTALHKWSYLILPAPLWNTCYWYYPLHFPDEENWGLETWSNLPDSQDQQEVTVASDPGLFAGFVIIFHSLSS